jgi:heat shock protein HslJ
VLGDGRLLESSREELGPISLTDLNGTSWRLVDLNLDQEPLPPGLEITLRFDEGQISGSDGCNDYTAGVAAGEDGLPQSLMVGPIAASQMLCDDPEATLETTYLARLGKVVAWRYAFGFLSLAYELEDSVLGELLFAPAGS